MKAILVCIGLLFVLTLDASNYRVVSRNALHVREGAGVESGIIGKLSSKDTVNVIEIENDWAKISYQDKEAYVSSKYIIPVKSNQKKSAKEFIQGIGALFSEGPISYLPLLIISTLLFTLLLRIIFSRRYLTKLIIGNIGMIGICVMEFIFFLGYFGEPWFCYPSNVGWVWAIVNFLLYGFVLLRQIRLGLDIIGESCYDKSLNLKVGIYSYVILVILGIIFSLANVDMFDYLVYGFIAAQIVQIIINFRSIRHFGKAFTVSFLFIMVCFAVIVSAMYFIAMLIGLLIILFFLSLVGSGANNSTVTEEIHHYH